MSKAVIAGYARSPFAPARKGALAKVRPDELMAQVVHGLLERSGADQAGLEDLIIGCEFPEGEQGLNVARIVGFLADLPPSVAGTTVNRFCGSSMQAVHMAAGAIATGAGEAFVCGGVESMSRVPMMGFNPLPHPGLYERAPEVYINMGLTAENLARARNLSEAWDEDAAICVGPRQAVGHDHGHCQRGGLSVYRRGQLHHWSVPSRRWRTVDSAAGKYRDGGEGLYPAKSWNQKPL